LDFLCRYLASCDYQDDPTIDVQLKLDKAVKSCMVRDTPIWRKLTLMQNTFPLIKQKALPEVKAGECKENKS
jgi:hypothetical protein